jgi:hypothetical protein
MALSPKGNLLVISLAAAAATLVRSSGNTISAPTQTIGLNRIGAFDSFSVPEVFQPVAR